MRNYFFITGSSKGLGKALCELLLEDQNNVVYGIARSHSIAHSNYTHFKLDLSKPESATNFEFPDLTDADKIVLVNNAGIVGDIEHVGKVNNQAIIDCYNLNLIAPAVMTNNFIAKYGDSSAEKLVVNISSGAGRTPIDGWNVYCSTKAGMDMFSQVMKEELSIHSSHTEVISLAPGIIDTGMQTEIRSSQKEGFSNIERFIEYKANGDLVQPQDTAKQVFRFIFEKELREEVLCSVRDLTN